MSKQHPNRTQEELQIETFQTLTKKLKGKQNYKDLRKYWENTLQSAFNSVFNLTY